MQESTVDAYVGDKNLFDNTTERIYRQETVTHLFFIVSSNFSAFTFPTNTRTRTLNALTRPRKVNEVFI